MQSRDLIILGILIIACTIISIFGTSFLILSRIQTGSIGPSLSNQTTQYPRFYLEGMVIEPISKKNPDKIVMDAALHRIDPEAGFEKVEIYIKEDTKVILRNVVTQEENPISISEIKANDDIGMRTLEDPKSLLSNGKLTRNSFTARTIIKRIVSRTP